MQVNEELIFEKVCKQILIPGMRTVAMQYSITSTILYDTLHEADNPRTLTKDDLEGWYSRSDEVYKSNRRLHRILKKLTLTEEKIDDADAKYFAKAKIFDEGMYEAMKVSYESIVEDIGDRAWLEMLPDRYMDALEIDGRNGLTFLELSILTCLYLSVTGPAVATLNTPLDSANKLKRGKLRVKKILETLYSDIMYQTLVRSCFDMLATVFESEYAQLMEEYCRTYWLPADKGNLKYLDYAMKYYALKTAEAAGQDETDEEIHICKLKSFSDEYDKITWLQYFFFRICIIAEAELLPIPEVLAEDSGFDEIDYLLAKRVGNVISTYVRSVQQSTEKLLRYLPEVASVKRVIE